MKYILLLILAVHLSAIVYVTFYYEREPVRAAMVTEEEFIELLRECNQS